MRFENTIPKSQTTTDDWLKRMKRCKTYQANQTTGRLYANRLRGKQQIHTIRHKCHHEGKSAAINKEIARKWRFKAVIHAQEGLCQNLPKNGSPKR